MATLQDRITKTFIEDLRETNEIPPYIVERLQAVLEADGKPKVDELIEIYRLPSDEEVK